MSRKPTDRTHQLSRRERQIMDVLYAQGQATAAEVLQRLPDPPSYSAVRAMLRILEEKGHVEHDHDGPRYVFRPIVERETARRGALEHLIRTFFDGSPGSAAAALLESADGRLEESDLQRLSDLIAKTRRDGR
jgi:predicted transcriptional regulator